MTKIIFKRLKIFLISITIVLASSNNIFAQNIGEKTGNAAWDYMHGRSLFGINFGPTLWAGIIDRIAGSDLFPLGDMLTWEGADLTGINVKKKHYVFGLGFSYDFAPLNFMSIGLDIGFSVGQMQVADYKISFYTVPWSLNVKFFVYKKAPFGFFLSPRFGGTAFKAYGSGIEILANGVTELHSHGGFYLSLELGWRIQLFPKRGANWPVQAGIDISLFDIGYYVAPWGNPLSKITQFESIEKFNIHTIRNIRMLLLPRLGITLRF